MKNYFQILQLPENATHEDIRQAYRLLAKKFHPDVNKSPDAHERFCEITEAYEFLINHWPKYSGQYRGFKDYRTRSDEYQGTDIFEQFRREVQERAKRQAKMRFEKFRQQHEAFQESGINDIGLLFTLIFRVLSIPLFFFLLLTPIVLVIFSNWVSIFTILFMWPFAIGIGWYYHDNKKNYFRPGPFYYSFDRILHLYTDSHPGSQLCYFCKNRVADSRPFKIELLKLKEVKLKTDGLGFRHNVNYVNKSYSVSIPRCRKAFIVHSLSIVIKIFSLIGCLIFLDISSIVWRFIIGIFLGGILTRILLMFSKTKSNVTYLYTYGLIIRIIIWITGICFASIFYFEPFNIYSSDLIHFVITVIVIFDSILMQLISMVIGNYSSYPVAAQYTEATIKFKEGYKVYNDVPVISVIYPMFKWIFG